MNYAVKHIKVGWTDESFESRINLEISKMTLMGWNFKDIKISSTGNNTLLIFYKKENMKEERK